MTATCRISPTSGVSSSTTTSTGLVTAFVDDSQIYRSDAARANALRSLVGGKLRTSGGNMLAFHPSGLANDNDSHGRPHASK